MKKKIRRGPPGTRASSPGGGVNSTDAGGAEGAKDVDNSEDKVKAVGAEGANGADAAGTAKEAGTAATGDAINNDTTAGETAAGSTTSDTANGGSTVNANVDGASTGDATGNTADGAWTDANAGDTPIEETVSIDETAFILAEFAVKLRDAEAQGREYLDRWQRSAAEFDNYKRRTQNEMDRLYASSAADVIAVFLPVVDSIERAICAENECVKPNADGNDGGIAITINGKSKNGATADNDKTDPFREGFILIERQIKDALKKLGVTPLPGVGEQFDPNLHEAVMHVEDETLGTNVIAQVFQQGYIYKERVVRHSVVKVAN